MPIHGTLAVYEIVSRSRCRSWYRDIRYGWNLCQLSILRTLLCEIPLVREIVRELIWGSWAIAANTITLLSEFVTVFLRFLFFWVNTSIVQKLIDNSMNCSTRRKLICFRESCCIQINGQIQISTALTIKQNYFDFLRGCVSLHIRKAN